MLLGGLDKDIHEFSVEEEKWIKVGEMSRPPRNSHAVSVVDFNDFKNLCQ